MLEIRTSVEVDQGRQQDDPATLPAQRLLETGQRLPAAPVDRRQGGLQRHGSRQKVEAAVGRGPDDDAFRILLERLESAMKVAGVQVWNVAPDQDDGAVLLVERLLERRLETGAEVRAVLPASSDVRR